MKTLIFSDTHLHKFKLKKYNFLKNIIQNHDKVIINGDFWDSWQVTAEEFIRSKYSSLFPLLVERDAIYIYGNHDPKNLITFKQASMFSNKQFNKYNFTQSDISFHVEHGHLILKRHQTYLHDKYNKITAGKVNLLKRIGKIQEVLYTLAPKTAINTAFGKKRNRLVKKLKDKDKFYIIGDTHTPELDLANKFANTGFIMSGTASYITIENDEISLTQAQY